MTDGVGGPTSPLAEASDIVVTVAIADEYPDDANRSLVESVLARRWVTQTFRFSLEDTIATLDGEARRTHERFAHTPQPLIDSWLAAHAIRRAVPPGSVILMGDRRGLGGMLALLEASAPDSERRMLWTVAGSGLLLETALVAGTIDHVDLPEAAILDWEIVQYRNADEVLATSEAAVEILGRFGAEGSLVIAEERPSSSDDAARPMSPTRPASIWVPGPVSRRNRSGDVLRAVASLSTPSITVSATDTPDDVWTGSTWDTLDAPRSTLGHRLRRSPAPPDDTDCVIIGDALEPPDATTVGLHGSGVPALAVAGSVAEAMWGGTVWSDSDDLVALLEGSAPSGTDAKHRRWEGPQRRPDGDEGRARRVSVGVPVGAPSPFLDECVESILAQTQQPHEVLLMVDGPTDDALEHVLGRWEDHPSGLVRVHRQPRRGVCVARNRMIEAMTGDAFVLVDHDDVLAPTFIERTALAMRADESLTAVASWTAFFGGYDAIEAKPPFDRRIGLRENPIVSTAALVDMTVRGLGITFAPDLAFLYCEDWHFWAQIVAAGGRMGLVPEALVLHRVHTASGGYRRTDLALDIGRSRAAEVLLTPAHRTADRTTGRTEGLTPPSG